MTLARTQHFSQQVGRMLARVANRRQGMPGSILLRVVRTFTVAKFAYALPYLELSKLETQKVDTLCAKLISRPLDSLPPLPRRYSKLLELTIRLLKLQKHCVQRTFSV
ncbi:hypothetical protein HPB48_002636 [Haemaphysalis longicornis]|uniref:Uncharacterized protein n=1 Tax=Haemaphysalis longicornis TaxID=44386 RepID=A0A9J6G0Q7_HAELO|nr:hypothetical protein HPB48_002636 [Haemaphysalis longicornis]